MVALSPPLEHTVQTTFGGNTLHFHSRLFTIANSIVLSLFVSMMGGHLEQCHFPFGIDQILGVWHAKW